VRRLLQLKNELMKGEQIRLTVGSSMVYAEPPHFLVDFLGQGGLPVRVAPSVIVTRCCKPIKEYFDAVGAAVDAAIGFPW
jgi:hypothetical protein